MTKRINNKTRLAKEMGVSRASLYYQPKRDTLDLIIKKEIESVLSKHRSYGHKRIALELKRNKKQILRVMKRYGIKPYRRRAKIPHKKDEKVKVQLHGRMKLSTFAQFAQILSGQVILPT